MKHTVRFVISITLALFIAGLALYVLLRPAPVKVEVARATTGPMRVTVDGEGKTRPRELFIVAAPVSGHLSRIDLRNGDTVKEGAIVARIDPLPLSPLDPRQRAEANARVKAAESVRSETEARVEHIRADLEQAKRELARAKYLIEHGDISRQEYEQTQNLVKTLTKDLEAAVYRAKAAASDVEATRAILLTLDKEQRGGPQTIIVRAPIRGSVLKVMEESERVVSAGTPLVELSNSSQLEIVIDVLSTDAVKIKRGAPVIIEGWGESETKQARVKLIEPMAFTKVSSLGIEEQRVNVIAEFESPPETLGIGYRVEARIVVWEKKEALKIPTSALFRQNEKWSVYVVENGKARRREVEIGPRAQFEVEIIKGVEDGAQVILHPSSELKDGVLVATGV